MPILTFTNEEIPALKEKLAKGGIIRVYSDKRTYTIQIVLTGDIKILKDDVPFIIFLKEKESNL